VILDVEEPDLFAGRAIWSPTRAMPAGSRAISGAMSITGTSSKSTLRACATAIACSSDEFGGRSLAAISPAGSR